MLKTIPNQPNPPLTPNNPQNPNPVSAVSLLALVDLTWDFSGQVFQPVGKWKLTPFAERFYQTVSPTLCSLTMSKPVCPKSKPCQMAEVSMLSLAVSPAKMCQWQEKGQDFTANAQVYSLTLWTLSEQLNQSSTCLKMSQVSSIQTMAKTYKQSLKRLPNAGMWDFGECLTAVISESPQKRRRVFLVAGLGEYPPVEFMADLGSVERISGKTESQSCWTDAHHTLLAGVGSSAININCADIIAVPNGRDQMAVRERTTVDDGLCKGLDETNATEARAAGNAVKSASRTVYRKPLDDGF